VTNNIKNKPLSSLETRTEVPRSDAFSSIWRIFPRRKNSNKRPLSDAFCTKAGLSTRENGTFSMSTVTNKHFKLAIAAR
jgi:hypothetical protein